MNILFHPNAWEDYSCWVQVDPKRVKRINALIRDIQRSPFDGVGKPEGLRFDLSGCWSRRIDDEHRLVYRVEEGVLHLLSGRHHY